jgi:hypothetical protein
MSKWLENGTTPTETSPNKKFFFKIKKLILDNQNALN